MKVVWAMEVVKAQGSKSKDSRAGWRREKAHFSLSTPKQLHLASHFSLPS
jgi:hypothetical protein